jgi:hypothetical protein
MMYLDRIDKSVLTYPGYGNERVKQVTNDLWTRVKGKSLGGPPAILRRQYIDAVKPLLDGKTCLDILSAAPKVQKVLSDWDISIYTGKDGNGSLVKDIGKQWKKDRGLRMVKRTNRGVSWKPKN